ncbi:Stage II sporulation protein E (SpoIIE) [Caballeronia calidae]|uniref:Stage II sporulation protein E (SpoIIE) n=1 Tax=Caballeronia calidae TaxID=1777139 RepID=A0A158DZC3_9BURK|nr:PP2C family serine/threonine-protein phosphatase [Caballeronia calidae]SAK99770.1 Stage II sporulation protein E (SpoIIE) [Caballeronia calidae]
MLRATGATVTGPGHLLDAISNQDAVRIRGERGGWFAAVADGLGSRARSRIGSRLAVRLAQRAWYADEAAPDARASIQRFYQSWLRALAAPPNAFATTVLAARCNAQGACHVIQLGDGLVLYRTAGVFGVLTGERTGFGNETHALGVTKSFAAWTTARIALSEPGDGVALMTDGVADDLRPERLEGFFGHLHAKACARSRRAGKRWLERQMDAWPTALHSDDKSIALIFRDSR